MNAMNSYIFKETSMLMTACKRFILATVIVLTLCSMALASGSPRTGEAQRIVNGSDATAGEWGFLAQLEVDDPVSGSWMCGASLVDSEWLVTAAHCVYDSGTVVDPDTVTVILGTYDAYGAGGDTYSVDRIIVHADYDAATSDSDVALLHLSSAATLDGTDVTTIDIVESGDPNGYTAIGTPVWTAGWGTLSSGGANPDTLQEVEVEVVDEDDPDVDYSSTDITANMMLAGEPGTWSKDSCQGDSGGPLIYWSGVTKVLVGVTSWGIGCADDGYPGVYTRLSRFASWIAGYVTGSGGNSNDTDSDTKGGCALGAGGSLLPWLALLSLGLGGAFLARRRNRG